MSEFQVMRIRHEHTQANDVPQARVFPLLCPVREAEWVPEWELWLSFSESGGAEDGCAFMTPNESGPETVLMATEYDPTALRIAVRIGLVLWPETRSSPRCIQGAYSCPNRANPPD